MKTKKSMRFMSAFLAFVMVISCAFSAFAAESYKATYTEKASKEVYETVIADANDLISKGAFTGNTVQEMYKLLPSLTSFIPEAKTADYYVAAEPEIFAGLSDYMAAASATDVTAEVLTGYFAENPVTVKDATEFTAKVNKFVEVILTKNMTDTVIMVILLGSSMTPSIGEANVEKFVSSIDGIFGALGVEQEKPLFDIVSGTAEGEKHTNLQNYFKTIVNAVMPDVAQSLISVLQNVAKDENNIALYSNLTYFMPHLYDMIVALEPMIGMFVPGLDLSPIKTPLEEINNVIKALPTKGEGENTMFDLEGVIAYLINDVLAAQVVGQRFDIISFGADGNGALKFDSMNLENLANAEDTTDAFNVIFHYLYTNLNKAENKALITNILPLLPSVAPDVPKEVTDYITYILENTEEDSVFELHALLRVANGHERPEPPKPPVDPENPTDPQQPTNPQKPTEPSEPTIPSNPDDVETPEIPDTGATEDASSMTAVVVASVALAGLALVLVSIKKRGFCA